MPGGKEGWRARGGIEIEYKVVWRKKEKGEEMEEGEEGRNERG